MIHLVGRTVAGSTQKQTLRRNYLSGGSFFPAPSHRRVGPEAGLGPAGQGPQGALASCSIQGTKSMNAGEAAASTPVLAPRHARKALGATRGWLRSAPKRTGPAGDGRSWADQSLPGHQSPPAAGAEPPATAAPPPAPLQPQCEAQPRVAELSL